MRSWLFPFRSLPPGFLATLDYPPDPPVSPRPASTLALLRRARRDREPGRYGHRVGDTGTGAVNDILDPKDEGLEVLLLKRHPRAGFIPSAWVFPGGLVDEDDGDPAILTRLHGISPRTAEAQLGSTSPGPPALAYWVAALRETFEETGILLLRGGRGEKAREAPVQPDASVQDIGSARSRLLAGEEGLARILHSLNVELDAGSLVYTGHWLTPECEPRRYETRFFCAEIGANTPVTIYQSEMVDALWISPKEALARNREGTLPLVLPTAVTLEELSGFQTPKEALEYLGDRPVSRRLPQPERVEGGILFHLPD